MYRDFRLFNQALLARQAWRIIDRPESLCARVLRAKCFPSGSLVDTSFGGNASPGWRAIEYGLELLKKGVIWRVGNGQQIRIWRDPWMPRCHSRRPITPKGTCRVKWVSELIGMDGRWNEQMVNQIFWPIDAEMILKIQLPTREGEDFLAWHPDRLGIFSVRSAYKLGLSLANVDSSSSSSEIETSKAWNLIWKCNIPQKVKIFAWRAATNCLATLENKRKRNLAVSDVCCICGVEKEDVAHALCRCPQAKRLWDVMEVAGKKAKDIVGSYTGASWILDQLQLVPGEEQPKFLMVLWRTWHVRNEITHGKRPPPIEASKRFLESYLSSLLEVKQHPRADLSKGKHVIQYGQQQKINLLKGPISAPCRWDKPPQGWMKLNVDGSFVPNTGKGGIGAILRNSLGEVIFSACGYLGRCNGPL